MGDTQVFATEEAKIEALDKILDTPENLAEIERITNAPVGETPPTEETPVAPAEKPVEPPEPSEVPAEKPVVPTDKKPDVIQIPLSELPEELRNFDSAGKLLKKIKNQDETIERQTQFIRERLQGGGKSEDEIETVRRENEELRRKLESAPAKEISPESKAAAAKSQSKLDEIVKRRKALLESGDVENRQFDADYIKESNQLQDLMLEEMNRLNKHLEAMSYDVEDTKKKASTIYQSREAERRKSVEDEVFEKQVKTIQSFVDSKDEFKLSKPLLEIDREYRDYQGKVASVYWGRPAKDAAEVQVAMQQLQRRSPNLVSALQAVQIPAEPTADMERYLAACEVWDSWQGIRKDPLTGDFQRDPKTGRVRPLMRWDPVTKQEVPDTYPTPEAAYNDLQVRGGHYTQKVLEAFKQGGKASAEARARRDGGVVEMDNSTGGRPRASEQQALEEINRIDEESAVMLARDGDPSQLKRYNELATIVGWPTL